MDKGVLPDKRAMKASKFRYNKQILQFLAALWILLFHLWLNVSGSQWEQVAIRLGYVGVDIFFFCSAYSLGDKKLAYLSFVGNRFLKVYSRFLFFVIVMALYKGWDLVRVFKTALFLDFFQKGGGAFLWFLPAIMVFYLIFPAFLQWKCRYKILLALAGWFLLSILSQELFSYTRVFIFTNRIPVILAGYWMKMINMSQTRTDRKDYKGCNDYTDCKDRKEYKDQTSWIPGWIGIIPLLAGLYLLYQYGFIRRLNQPLNEFYFVFGILVVVGLALLGGYVKESKGLALLSSATLEVYALQMIFGSRLVTSLYLAVGNKLLTNLLMILTIYGGGILLAWVFNRLVNYPSPKGNGLVTAQSS